QRCKLNTEALSQKIDLTGTLTEPQPLGKQGSATIGPEAKSWQVPSKTGQNIIIGKCAAADIRESANKSSWRSLL
ncbi:MAG: hypothetical protein ACK5M8_02955, partial [Shewanella algae]